MSLLLLGMSHRTASVELRERYAVEDARPLLTKLIASPEIDEAVLIGARFGTKQSARTAALGAVAGFVLLLAVVIGLGVLR